MERERSHLFPTVHPAAPVHVCRCVRSCVSVCVYASGWHFGSRVEEAKAHRCISQVYKSTMCELWGCETCTDHQDFKVLSWCGSAVWFYSQTKAVTSRCNWIQRFMWEILYLGLDWCKKVLKSGHKRRGSLGCLLSRRRFQSRSSSLTAPASPSSSLSFPPFSHPSSLCFSLSHLTSPGGWHMSQ